MAENLFPACFGSSSSQSSLGEGDGGPGAQVQHRRAEVPGAAERGPLHQDPVLAARQHRHLPNTQRRLVDLRDTIFFYEVLTGWDLPDILTFVGRRIGQLSVLTL